MEFLRRPIVNYSINNNFNGELSPAKTSIELFLEKNEINAKKNTRQMNGAKNATFLSPINIEYNCSICNAEFGLEAAKAAPKCLPCGHNFCYECIFSLCLHREYYLLDKIKCSKCNVLCEARLALKAPINYELCNLLKNDYCTSSPSVVTIIQKKPKIVTKKTNLKRVKSTTNLISQTTKWQRKKSRFKSVKNEKNILNKRIKQLNDSIPDDPASFGLAQMFFGDRTNCKKNEMATNFLDDERSNFCQKNYNKLIENLSDSRQTKFANEILIISKKLDKIFSQINRDVALLQTKCEIDNDFKNLLTSSSFINEIMTFFKNAKYILLNEIQIEERMKITEAQQNSFIRRFEKLYTCLTQKVDTKYFQICLLPLKNDEDKFIVSLLLCICVYIETVLSISIFSFTELRLSEMTSLQRRAFFTLEKCLREIQSVCEIFNESKLNIYSLIQRCAINLTSFLNENCSSEMILFALAAFFKIFVLLKHLLRYMDCSKISAEKNYLWKTVQTAFSELLRIASLHWQISNINRIHIVSCLTDMCVLFADVCDTSTILVCMIEAARARVSYDNYSKDEKQINYLNKSIDNNLKCDYKHHAAQYYFKKIDENLIECRRVQKLADLRLRTKMVKKTPIITEISTATITVTPTSTQQKNLKQESALLSNQKIQRRSHFLYRLFRFKRQK